MTKRGLRKDVPVTAHASMDDYPFRAVIFSGGHECFGTFSKLRYDKCDDFAICADQSWNVRVSEVYLEMSCYRLHL